MRLVGLGIALSVVVTAAAQAFEIEEQRLFPSPDGTDGAVLKVISTTDTEIFTPLASAFQAQAPGVAVDYSVVSSAELDRALRVEGAAFDIALSSAMDLQTKLANDGLVRTHRSADTERLPDWANWRDQVFAFTQEPATIVVSPSAFDGLEVPRTRQALISLLRSHSERFQGRIGTYDVRESGLGYLFATQDSRNSEIYWRLTEVFGRMGAELYCCSSQMIQDVAEGHIAVAYNVLGSYARARQALGDPIVVVEPQDFTTVMLRTAVIPTSAESPALAGSFVDFLIAANWEWLEQGDGTPFAPILASGEGGDPGARRPIRIGPGLLVFLDPLKRKRFLSEWQDAILQR
ncbi:iron(III) transport system substrate-binding protein [Aliiruegeria haliotis]|uniref:Iron(III) transport system substrate-binding protein n=1 Tax=Aliiruegeria haliotis TaxID=1280846 RepID=A0A2T0RZU4_9RHOB|nr:ABC transporter substrate-binding protein [Aliiruegeria haliotis]PRY26694.1 iron(III) transport system substrate-binding protein [Aliiruegeria haliotis]